MALDIFQVTERYAIRSIDDTYRALMDSTPAILEDVSLTDFIHMVEEEYEELVEEYAHDKARYLKARQNVIDYLSEG